MPFTVYRKQKDSYSSTPGLLDVLEELVMKLEGAVTCPAERRCLHQGFFLERTLSIIQ